MEVIYITLKTFLKLVSFLLIIKAVVLSLYLLWKIQIIIGGMVLPQGIIIAGIITDIILAYTAFTYTKKKK